MGNQHSENHGECNFRLTASHGVHPRLQINSEQAFPLVLGNLDVIRLEPGPGLLI